MFFIFGEAFRVHWLSPSLVVILENQIDQTGVSDPARITDRVHDSMFKVVSLIDFKIFVLGIAFIFDCIKVKVIYSV